MFPALSVFRNLAHFNALDPYFWLDDVLVARDVDEAKILGMLVGAGRCKNWVCGNSSKHQTNKQTLLVCWQGPVGAEFGTLNLGASCVFLF